MHANASGAKQRHQDAFAKAMDQLDEYQRQAVTHIDGPVAVIAGPGAGKTHILAARVGYILNETDARPENILCLTFTDAGVNAMRARLLQFIGPEAHHVPIFTFHAFCNAVIQDNLEWFGRRELEPISDLERIEISRRILDGLEPEHPLRAGQTNPYVYERQFRDLIQLMKREDWTYEYVSNCIDVWLEDLPNRPEYRYNRNGRGFQKGDLKQMQIAEEHTRMERLRAAAKLFAEYEEAMFKARRYDYDDMILWVLRAFERHEFLLRNYQERYHYFMVDEYQDTNGAQNEVLHKLIEYWDDPNVFIVGDDDQSVYEFQGARLHNLAQFIQTFAESIELIVLPNNYRSSQHILDAASSVIRQNSLRVVNKFAELGIEKHLKAKHPEFAGLEIRPVLRVFPNPLHEFTSILQQIQDWQAEGVPLESIALIYVRHRQAELLQRMLERAGIPFQTRRRPDILKLPLMHNLQDLFRYFALEARHPGSGEYLLFRLLHVDFLGISPSDISRLALYMARLEGNRPFWRAILHNSEILQAAGVADLEAFHRLSRCLDELQYALVNENLIGFTERVINRTGLLAFILSQPDAVSAMEILRTFFDLVERESQRSRTRLTVDRLLEILDSYSENDLTIEVQRQTEPLAGVQLLTAHSAKGLEFDRVFMLDAVKTEWESGNRGGRGHFPLPETLTRSGEADELEARRRLFYVAMTRAKSWLQISWSTENAQGKALSASRFVDELQEEMDVEIQPGVLPRAELLKGLTAGLSEIPKISLAVPDTTRVAALLENYALSISGSNQYLNCPLEFYHLQVLRVPAPFSDHAAYGSALHLALRRYYERMLADREHTFPDLPTFKFLFEEEMRRLESRFAPGRFDHYLQTGLSRIEGLHRQEEWRAHRGVKVEYTIRRTHIEGVPLTGVIDKIEFHPRLEVVVSDYKTGKPERNKLNGPTRQDPLGKPFWRQLAFYKILYESFDLSSRIVKKGALTFLDPDAKGHFQTYEVEFDPAEISEFKSLILQTYERIKAQDFYTGCGKSDCVWCNFLQHREPVNSFSLPEIEALDDTR